MLQLRVPPSPAARGRSGTACDNAPNIASIKRKPLTPRAATAAGRRGLNRQPSGAATRIGRMKPELFGASDSMIARIAKYTADRAKDNVELIAPLTCGELPARSAVSSSCATRSVALTVTG